jgi:hypothetical protein
MSGEVRPTPPPPPGPGLVWVSHQDHVEQVVQDMLRQLDRNIDGVQDADLRKAMQRRRLELQTMIATTVRTIYAAPLKEPT